MGSSRAARTAGYSPEIKPTATDTPVDSTMDDAVRLGSLVRQHRLEQLEGIESRVMKSKSRKLHIARTAKCSSIEGEQYGNHDTPVPLAPILPRRREMSSPTHIMLCSKPVHLRAALTDEGFELTCSDVARNNDNFLGEPLNVWLEGKEPVAVMLSDFEMGGTQWAVVAGHTFTDIIAGSVDCRPWRPSSTSPGSHCPIFIKAHATKQAFPLQVTRANPAWDLAI
jgi:hypothetical protein